MSCECGAWWQKPLKRDDRRGHRGEVKSAIEGNYHGVEPPVSSPHEFQQWKLHSHSKGGRLMYLPRPIKPREVNRISSTQPKENRGLALTFQLDKKYNPTRLHDEHEGSKRNKP